MSALYSFKRIRALAFTSQERNHASCIEKGGAGATAILLIAFKQFNFIKRKLFLEGLDAVWSDGDNINLSIN